MQSHVEWCANSEVRLHEKRCETLARFFLKSLFWDRPQWPLVQTNLLSSGNTGGDLPWTCLQQTVSCDACCVAIRHFHHKSLTQMGLLFGTREFRAWRNTCTVGQGLDRVLQFSTGWSRRVRRRRPSRRDPSSGETDGSPLYDDGTYDTDASHQAHI